MLAALFGILSAMLMFAFLNSRGGSSSVDDVLNSGAGAESVVVVTKPINVGDKITSDMLGTATVPKTALIPGYIPAADAKSLEGKVATTPIFPGEQVLTSKVSTYDGQNTLAWKVPDGMRAVSLQVPHEAWIAAGLPQPGDHVDVLGISTLMRTDPLTGEDVPDTVAGYVAQDVQVLAVAQTLVKSVANVDAKKGSATSTSSTAGAPATPATGSAPASAASAAVATGDPTKDAATYELSISITLALPPDLAAKVALLDAMKDDVAQYRILVRQKGDAVPISGTLIWDYNDVFPTKKK
jgi:Flp pilus assembly protein CpaB